MKVVIFKGGLGNQLFQYCLYCKLKGNGRKVRAIDFCKKSHNGLEIEKYFEINLHFASSACIFLFFKLCALPQRLRNFFVIDENHYHEKFYSLFYNDFWQDKKYFPIDICSSIIFKQLPLTVQNSKTLEIIKQKHSVSIHVRRGDYLERGISDVFVNLSETDYYNKAIAYVCQKVINPSFFIFSNDIDWCKENLIVPNSFFVDWNTGDDSIYDMYLMSNCKVNIIANSTFSYWGACLNREVEKVLFPLQWFKSQKSPIIFPEAWVGL